MELLSWSLNAIDRVFSTRKAGAGEIPCPDGTFMSGYTLDSWKEWKVVCLAALDIEDVEDVYIFAGMTVGMVALGIALGTALYVQYRKLKKLIVAQADGRDGRFTALKDMDGAAVREGIANLASSIASIKGDITVIKGKVAGIDGMKGDIADIKGNIQKMATVDGEDIDV